MKDWLNNQDILADREASSLSAKASKSSCIIHVRREDMELSVAKKRLNSKGKFIFFSLAPILVLFFVFLILPIFLSFILSFYNYNPLSANPPFIGLKNYYNLLKDEAFITSFKNTVYFVIVSVAINLALSTIIAVAITSIKNTRHKNIFRTIFFLPTTANIAAIAIVWNYLLDPNYGAVATVLSKLGIYSRIYWIGDVKLVLIAIIIINLWQDMGYNIVIIQAGLEGIPRMIYESALIDGANKIITFFKITLPLLVRTMLFVSVMTVISYFQVFTQVMVLTRGGPNHASELMAVNIYLNAFNNSRLGYASAAAIFLLILMLIISMIQIKFVKADWEY